MLARHGKHVFGAMAKAAQEVWLGWCSRLRLQRDPMESLVFCLLVVNLALGHALRVRLVQLGGGHTGSLRILKYKGTIPNKNQPSYSSLLGPFSLIHIL
jgi:hypothetical protein